MLRIVMQRVQLNVDVSRESYDAAKRGAEDSGMFLYRWIEKALLEKAGTQAALMLELRRRVEGREQSLEMGAQDKEKTSRNGI